LATFVVTTPLDVVDSDDGLISLREAVTAANTNAAFSDASAGEDTGDRIIFSNLFDDQSVVAVLMQGEIEITDDLVVRGSTRISGNNQSRIFNVNTTERVRFQEVTLLDGTATTPQGKDNGGLVYVQPGSDVVIFNSAFMGGNADLGGALFVDSSEVQIRGFSQFAFNDVVEDPFSTEGGGLSEGGAIYAIDSDITISGGEFAGNTAINGGAIATAGGALRLFSVDFGGTVIREGNSAERGGALFTNDTSVLTNSSFFENTSTIGGGAIYSTGNVLHVLPDSNFRSNGLESFDSNDSEVHFGGAIWSSNDSLFISDASFTGNRSDSGGAIFSVASQAVFNRISVTENEASDSGGGIRWAGLDGTAFISDSTISRNVALGGEEGFGGGGGIVNTGRLVLRRVTLESNVGANSGGAISSSNELVVFGSELSRNSVANSIDASVGSGSGGAIFASGDLTVAGSNFDFNFTSDSSSDVDSGSSFASGGAIFASSATAFIFDSEFSFNRAANSGGALAVNEGFLRVADSTLQNNSANAGGAAAAIDLADLGTTLVFVGGQLEANNAATGGAIWVGPSSRIAGPPTIRLVLRDDLRLNFNVASEGGAIFSNDLVNASGVMFDGNNAQFGGAVLLAENSIGFFNNSTFQLNSVGETGSGSAILSRGSDALSLTDSLFEENSGGDFPVFGEPFNFLSESGLTFVGNTPNNGIGPS